MSKYDEFLIRKLSYSIKDSLLSVSYLNTISMD